jgi:hypothetical protein
LLRALTARSPFLVASCLLFLCSLAYLASRPFFTTQVAGNVRMRDFVSPYTGARCLFAGCNPYELNQIEAEFANSGGAEVDHAPWRWEPPVYPPSSLVVLLPFAVFHFHAARALWFTFSLLCFCGAIFTAVYLTEPRQRPWAVLLCALLLPSKFVAELVGIGQPSTAAMGLSAVALLLLWKGRAPAVAIILLGIGLALKPQIAIAIFLVVLFRRRTSRAAVLSGVLAALILFVGAAWLSVNPHSRGWLTSYRAEIATSVSGGVNDPSWDLEHGRRMLNLQASIAGFARPALASALAWAVAGALFVLLARAYSRRADSRSYLRDALAAAVCIAFLPIYHRDYDLPMLLLTFPAALALCARRSLLAIGILLLTLALALTPRPPTALWGHFGNKPIAKIIPGDRVRILLLARQDPLILFCLAAFYTAVLVRRSSREPIPTY